MADAGERRGADGARTGGNGPARGEDAAEWLSPMGAYAVAPQLPVEALDAVGGCPRLAMQLLYNRGVTTPEDVRAFLDSDWRANGSALPDVERAVRRLLRARDAGERVVVWGDFDCDGMTSCALLVEALRWVGVRAEPYVAAREDDGRGLNLAGVRALAEAGARVIVTTDCGTANVAEVALAAELGADVIITDHHPPHGETATPYALVNPRREGADARAADLAGVGVALRLAERLLAEAGTTRGDGDEAPSLESLLDLVAIGTIADVVPLTPVNWALVRAGLRRLNAEPRPGVRALLDAAGLRPGMVVARDVGFSLAPRLNACGRLGDPMLAVRLLLARDAVEARGLMGRIEELHQRRQEMTGELTARVREIALREAGADADGGARRLPRVVVATADHLEYGLIGLVAGRLADELKRAVFVISRNGKESRGSGRGPAGMDLGKLLAARPELFKRFGGHAQAAGFTIATEDLPELKRYLSEIAPEDAEDAAVAGAGAVMATDGQARPGAIAVDCVLPLRRLVRENLEAVRLLEPYGVGFPEPVFVARGVTVERAWPSGPEGRTLRLRLRDVLPDGTPVGAPRTAMWPRHGHLWIEIERARPTLRMVDVVYTLAPPGRGGDEYAPRILALVAAERA